MRAPYVSIRMKHSNYMFRLFYDAFKNSPEHEHCVRLNGGKEHKLRIAPFAVGSRIICPMPLCKPITFGGGWAQLESTFHSTLFEDGRHQGCPAEVFFLPPHRQGGFSLLGAMTWRRTFDCVVMLGVPTD